MAKIVSNEFKLRLSKIVKSTDDGDFTLEEGFEALIAETLESIFEGAGIVVEVEKGA